MGDVYIFKCPNCGDDIYVGRGINDGEDGKIHCTACGKDFKQVTFLVPYDATTIPNGYGYGALTKD